MLRYDRTLLLVVVLREQAYVHNRLGLGVTYILWGNQSQGKSAGGVSLLPPKRDRTLYRDIERNNTYRERNYMDRDIVTKHTNRIYVSTYSMYVLTILLAI